MKLRRPILYVVISILFTVSFYVVNLRFDPFYRVNGINNDNRVLLEQYLTNEEQDYLVENHLDINLFLPFLKYDQFSLYNYQYYALLNDYTNLSNKSIVKTGNRLAEALENQYSNKTDQYAKTIISLDLYDAYLNNASFNYDYCDCYALLKPLYKSNDYSFIDDCNDYISILNQENFEDTYEVFSFVVDDYHTKKNIKDFMLHTLKEGQYKIYHPSALDTILSKDGYIGNYEPNNLILVTSVSRVKYATYLTKEANDALKDMNKALKKVSKDLLIYSAFENNSSNRYDEARLGNTVDLSQKNVNYNDFDDSVISKWLEEHSYEYGFILRYPKGKASYTNAKHNSHIYRYVGKEIAKQIYDQQICLEEYLLRQR